ncbi:hypothetical protein L7F22_067964 [Adiantum nelumboides]|nr:hypothetical protein [Adiantum nelumboides]
MQSIRPAIKARRDKRRMDKEGWKLNQGEEWPEIDVILVAYLPNEQDIIMRQVRYALTKIDYPSDKLMINVVYNTPKPIPGIEAELAGLENQYDNVRIISVPNSRSKAENINYFLTLPSRGKIITVYDTDHFPEPTALRWVAKRFLTGEVDIIQGRCCTYNHTSTWLTRMIGVEFDMIYGVMHSGRAEVQRYGFFGGSNGHWNASLLRTLGMQGHMLTEDIDSSLRAIISGARIEYDLHVLSYEQAPETMQAFTKQRLRWSQGWTQVAMRHFIPACKRGAYSDDNGWRSRVGLLQLLVYREIYFISIHNYSGLVSSESYPTAIRGTAYGLSAAIGKVGAVVGTEVFKPVQDNLGKKYIFIIAACIGVTGATLAFFTIIDTSKLNLAEEDEKWRQYLLDNGWNGLMGDGTVTEQKASDLSTADVIDRSSSEESMDDK